MTQGHTYHTEGGKEIHLTLLKDEKGEFWAPGHPNQYRQDSRVRGNDRPSSVKVSFVDRFLNWAAGVQPTVKETKIHFIRFSSTVYAYTQKPLEKYLRDIGFVEDNNRSVSRKGFVCIDRASLEIWHHGISPKRTVIDGDMKPYIDNFSRI